MGAGVISRLNEASFQGSGDQLDLGGILVRSVVGGAVYGVAYLYLLAFLFRVIGGWLHGRGTFVEVRAACAWSAVVFIWMGLLWIPYLLLFGKEMFTTEMPRVEASVTLSAIYMALGIVHVAGALWCFVVLLNSVGEAHGLSAWRALVVVLGGVLGAALLWLLPFGIWAAGE